jgi:hypothetical protein
MPVLEFGPFAELARSGGVIAGLDLGTKTIGVAVADRGLVLAHPRPVINRTKFSADVSLLLEVFAREHGWLRQCARSISAGIRAQFRAVFRCAFSALG